MQRGRAQVLAAMLLTALVAGMAFLFCLFPLLWSMRSFNRLETPFTEGAKVWLVLVGVLVSLLFFGHFAAFWVSLLQWQADELAFHALMAQPFYAGFLPPLWAGAVMATVAGLARLDRFARRLHELKGLNRFFALLPLAIALLFVQGVLWGTLRQRFGFSANDCFVASAVLCFGLGGWLRWSWLNWTWAEKTIPVKPPLAFLPETFAWRTVITFLPFLGYWLAGEGQGLDANFLALWLMVNLLDIGCLAWSHHLALQVLLHWGRTGFNALAVFSLAIPLLAFIPKLNFLASLSPSVGLLMFASKGKLAAMLKLPSVTLSSWWIAQMVALRWGLVAMMTVGVLRLPSSVSEKVAVGGTSFKRPLLLLHQACEWLFFIPKLEVCLLEGVDNPVFRHMVRTTRWRLSWLPYFFALLSGFLFPSAIFLQLVIGFFLAPFFWFTSYQAMHRYLRKLHQTGELWQWLITPLPSRAILKGLLWGGWWWQMRWLGLVFWFSIGSALSGTNLLGVPFPKLLHFFPFAPFVNLFGAGLSLLLWIALTFGAVPVTIREIFRHPQKAFAKEGTLWARSQAIGYAVLISLLNCLCGCITLIYGVSALSLRLDPSVRALDEIRRAPMERLPLT